MTWWKPTTTTELRPAPGDAKEPYVRSFLFLRTMIGLVGLALPVALLVVDRFWLKGSATARGSLSAYYYSGMRDVFVGALVATGLFLVAYKVVERDLDNTLSTLAGVAVAGVALFPTSRPAGRGLLTPLQETLGEGRVAGVHFTCAGIFILSLAVICFLFGRREGRRSSHGATLPPQFWQWFHWACAAVIVLAVAYIGLAHVFAWGSHSLLYGESASVLAFGASWLAKGAELKVLLGRRPAEAGLALAA